MDQRKQEIIEAIISKSWEDINFRKEIIANPIDAIEKLTGIKVTLPEGKTLIVNDQTDKSKVYVNIPAEPEIESMELSEEQLEIVAGGGYKIWDGFVNNLFLNLKDCITL